MSWILWLGGEYLHFCLGERTLEAPGLDREQEGAPPQRAFGQGAATGPRGESQRNIVVYHTAHGAGTLARAAGT